MMQSRGKALITGADRPLGRAMALCLAARGHDVALHCAGNRAGAETTAGEARALGVQARVLLADLLDEGQTVGLIAQAAQALDGPLTVLINNASIHEQDTLHSATPDSWHRHFGSNLRAPFVLTQAFAAQAPRATRDPAGEWQAPGLVINIIDPRMRKPSPQFMTYTLAMTGLWSLTRTSALALAPDIRVNAIGPGPSPDAARPEDVIATLGYFLDAPVVTGQFICTDAGPSPDWQPPRPPGAA